MNTSKDDGFERIEKILLSFFLEKKFASKQDADSNGDRNRERLYEFTELNEKVIIKNGDVPAYYSDLQSQSEIDGFTIIGNYYIEDGEGENHLNSWGFHIILEDMENTQNVYSISVESVKHDSYRVWGSPITVREMRYVNSEQKEDLIYKMASDHLVKIFKSKSLPKLSDFFILYNDLSINKIFDYTADRMDPDFARGINLFFQSMTSDQHDKLEMDSNIERLTWHVSPQQKDDIFVTAYYISGRQSEEKKIKKDNHRSPSDAWTEVDENGVALIYYFVSSQIRKKVLAKINNTGNLSGEITNINHDSIKLEKTNKKRNSL